MITQAEELADGIVTRVCGAGMIDRESEVARQMKIEVIHALATQDNRSKNAAFDVIHDDLPYNKREALYSKMMKTQTGLV